MVVLVISIILSLFQINSTISFNDWKYPVYRLTSIDGRYHIALAGGDFYVFTTLVDKNSDSDVLRSAYFYMGSYTAKNNTYLLQDMAGAKIVLTNFEGDKWVSMSSIYTPVNGLVFEGYEPVDKDVEVKFVKGKISYINKIISVLSNNEIDLRKKAEILGYFDISYTFDLIFKGKQLEIRELGCAINVRSFQFKETGDGLFYSNGIPMGFMFEGKVYYPFIDDFKN